MTQHLGGDRKRLDEDGPSRSYLRVWIFIGLLLAAIAFAVWRHAG